MIFFLFFFYFFAGIVECVQAVALIILSENMHHTSLGKRSKTEKMRCNERHHYDSRNSCFFVFFYMFAGRVGEVQSVAMIIWSQDMHDTSLGKRSKTQEMQCNARYLYDTRN